MGMLTPGFGVLITVSSMDVKRVTRKWNGHVTSALLSY